MKPQNFNQEILLFTKTSFARQEFSSRDADNQEGQNYSFVDKLEMACWNGLLEVMLPELNDDDTSKQSFIWQINREENFLRICMGNYDAPVGGESSIDPYYFIAFANMN